MHFGSKLPHGVKEIHFWHVENAKSSIVSIVRASTASTLRLSLATQRSLANSVFFFGCASWSFRFRVYSFHGRLDHKVRVTSKSRLCAEPEVNNKVTLAHGVVAELGRGVYPSLQLPL